MSAFVGLLRFRDRRVAVAAAHHLLQILESDHPARPEATRIPARAGGARCESRAGLTGATHRNYNVDMKARIVRIGNSRGIRIPKAVLEQANVGEEVQIEAGTNEIVIRPARVPRQGWDEAFRRMSERGDDVLDDQASLTAFDDTEWTW